MNNPNLYSTANAMQKYDAKLLIDNYFNNIKWLPNGGDISLDIGCGDGGVTYEFLLNNMPNNAEKIIGTDISEQMIMYANEYYQHRKLKFEYLDISSKTLSEQFIGKFDHVFSLNCLHWVHDQRQAFQNIYDLLKSNGDMLVSYVASSPVFSIYETLSKLDKWKSYMLDYTKYICPYHNNLNTEEDLTKLLESIGFEVVICKCEKRQFVYKDLESWINFIKTVNPFLNRIPESNRNEYIDQFLEECKKHGVVVPNNVNVTKPYDELIVYAQKKI
ncbi:juvenile hormone acid O-methyltransferase-like [Chrysoperla carnea]|uniref:juvenile hormone acid O-methyltransferase-like n=1 Tax=Chrysoperla carnea TaxID=189513 RepID=UPI001D07C424|nr:juvenile hormone acid O-methyltransferase-like [Chrysoperla carnea]